jgi:hypothetical protein
LLVDTPHLDQFIAQGCHQDGDDIARRPLQAIDQRPVRGVLRIIDDGIPLIGDSRDAQRRHIVTLQNCHNEPLIDRVTGVVKRLALEPVRQPRKAGKKEYNRGKRVNDHCAGLGIR